MATLTGFGNVPAERAAVEATYEDTLTIQRPGDAKEGNITRTVLRKVGSGICALSQSGGGAGNQTDTFNLVEYDAKVFTLPELVFQKGDTVTIRRFGRYDPASERLYTFEPIGEAAVYPTHQEVLLKVRDKA